MSNPPKIIFLGTPEFAKIILASLTISEYKPMAVITEPDKPIGRKQILISPIVKEFALKVKIPVFQPETSKELLEKIKELKPDLLIVAAYGRILSQSVLDVPLKGCLNVHPSLLPKYRGASPIQNTILNGDKKTGVTIMLMDAGMDHGPILSQQEYIINNLGVNNNLSSIKNLNITNNIGINMPKLSEKLAKLGGKLLIKTISQWINGQIKPQEQKHSEATYTKLIKKKNGRIKWENESAEQIERKTRAYTPWPGVYAVIQSLSSKLDQKKIKIIQAFPLELEPSNQNINHSPGEIFLTKNKKLAVASSQGALILGKVQIEGKKQISGEDLLNGHPKILESILI